MTVSSSDRCRTEAVLFDGDDTLWETEPLYDRARGLARQIVEGAGLDGERWESLEREIDVANIAVLGLSSLRFPTSCRQAYLVLVDRSDAVPRPEVAEKVFNAASTVFSSKAPLMKGALNILRALQGRTKIILLTQGERVVQRKRIADSGLERYFDEIKIVDKKSAETFKSVITELNLDPARSWMVGNSIPSDVNPALEAGLQAIWVDAHVWEHERREQAAAREGLVVASSLDDVLSIVLTEERDLSHKG